MYLTAWVRFPSAQRRKRDSGRREAVNAITSGNSVRLRLVRTKHFLLQRNWYRSSGSMHWPPHCPLLPTAHATLCWTDSFVYYCTLCPNVRNVVWSICRSQRCTICFHFQGIIILACGATEGCKHNYSNMKLTFSRPLSTLEFWKRRIGSLTLHNCVMKMVNFQATLTWCLQKDVSHLRW